MPIASAPMTSQRLLTLLSLLQARRDWPAPTLAKRLDTSERTIRRDIERLRELGYAIDATRGPDGGYRLGAGADLPPLLLDDGQAVAIALTLRTAGLAAAGIEEDAARALQTVSRLMPDRLARRIAHLEVGAVDARADRVTVDPDVLLRIGEAIRATEELRFSFAGEVAEPRRTEPHHLLLHGGRWYLVGWTEVAADWRTYRVDRMDLRSHTGRRFAPREVPGGDPAAFLAARFKGSDRDDVRPCIGRAIVHLPARELAPYVGDGTVVAVDAERSRVEAGSWSWVGLAASLGRFGADMSEVEPQELRAAFAELAGRYAIAGREASSGAERWTTS